MKRFGLLLVLMMLCGLPAYSQFWINFGWDEPHCQNCLWMERTLRLPERKAAEYHRLIHVYGKKIEKETRRDSRYWDRAARNIYNYRLERDRKIQYLLTPAQFNLYIRYSREQPRRIHDYQGWYNNPHYPDYRPVHDCYDYEENYWNYRWNNVHYDNHWRDERRRNDRYRGNEHSYDNGRRGNSGLRSDDNHDNGRRGDSDLRRDDNHDKGRDTKNNRQSSRSGSSSRQSSKSGSDRSGERR